MANVCEVLGALTQKQKFTVQFPPKYPIFTIEVSFESDSLGTTDVILRFRGEELRFVITGCWSTDAIQSNEIQSYNSFVELLKRICTKNDMTTVPIEKPNIFFFETTVTDLMFGDGNTVTATRNNEGAERVFLTFSTFLEELFRKKTFAFIVWPGFSWQERSSVSKGDSVGSLIVFLTNALKLEELDMDVLPTN